MFSRTFDAQVPETSVSVTFGASRRSVLLYLLEASLATWGALYRDHVGLCTWKFKKSHVSSLSKFGCTTCVWFILIIFFHFAMCELLGPLKSAKNSDSE